MGLSWVTWRLIKFGGISLLASGLWTATQAEHQRVRLSAAHWQTWLGLLLSWIAGYALMKASGRSFTPWIFEGMVASLVASSGALLAASRPSATGLGAGLAVTGFVAATTTMIGRGTVPQVWQLGLPIVLGLVGALVAGRREAPSADSELEARQLQWFTWVARLEGASLLLMVGVSMPLRMATGISLDRGQGWIGWIHGILVLTYMQALIVTASAARWSWRRILAALVASMLPGGTFVFERRVL